jgi:hypothetical protein
MVSTLASWLCIILFVPLKNRDMWYILCGQKFKVPKFTQVYICSMGTTVSQGTSSKSTEIFTESHTSMTDTQHWGCHAAPTSDNKLEETRVMVVKHTQIYR